MKSIYSNIADSFIEADKELEAGLRSALAPKKQRTTPFLDYQEQNQPPPEEPPELPGGAAGHGVPRQLPGGARGHGELPPVENAWYQTMVEETIKSLPVSNDVKNNLLAEYWAYNRGVTLPRGTESPNKQAELRGVGPPRQDIGWPQQVAGVGENPAEQLIGEWLMPGVLPGGLLRTPFALAGKVLPKAITGSVPGKITSKALDILVGKFGETRPPIVRGGENLAKSKLLREMATSEVGAVGKVPRKPLGGAPPVAPETAPSALSSESKPPIIETKGITPEAQIPPVDPIEQMVLAKRAAMKAAPPTGGPPVKPPIPPAGPPVKPSGDLPKPTPIQNVRTFYKAKIDDIKGATQDKLASLEDWNNYTTEQRASVYNENVDAIKGATQDKIASLKDWNKYSLEEQKNVLTKTFTEKLADVQGAASDKIVSLKDWAKYTVEEKQRAGNILTDYIQEKLPLRERGKLLDAVKNIKTQEQLDDVFVRVDQIAETSTQRDLRLAIGKELKRARPVKVKGVVKGKFTAPIQSTLDGVTHNLGMDRNIAKTKIAENIDSFTKGLISEEDMLKRNEFLGMAGIKSQNSSELSTTLKTIQQLKTTGRTERQSYLESIKTARVARNATIVNEVTGKKGLKELAGSIPSEATDVTEGPIGKFFNRNYSFGSLMEKLSKLDKGAPRQSALAGLDRMAFTARETENAGIGSAFKEIQQIALDSFKAKDRGELSTIWRTMTHEKINLPIKLTDGRTINMELTKGQIIKKYQEMLDPTLQDTFEKGMKWDYNRAKDTIANALTPGEKKWATAQMEFYQKYWATIDDIYSKKYGVHLGNNPNYSPIRRNVDTDIPEDLLVYEDLGNYASVVNASLKARVQNLKPLKFTDANEVFVNHLQQMEHFKAWVNPISELRSTFGNKEVRAGIAQYHGRDILNQVDTLIDRFARGGVDRQHTVHALDVMRANFSRSILGLKPNIALQQVTTLPMYLSEMSVKELGDGVLDFLKNPAANYRKAMESGYLQARYTQGFERDIAAARNMNLYRRAFSGQGSIKDWSYSLMEVGDKFGVIPGWWAKYKAGLKQGLFEVDAMREAGMAVDRTQNTSAIDSLSTLQSGGSFWKALTMFQNQPNKYFQIIANNMRDIKYGRGDPVKAAAVIALAWAGMPALFQFVADGFQFKKERQARAVVLGPVNDLLVVGQIAQFLGDKIAGEPFGYQPSPATAAIDDTGNLIGKVRTIWGKWQDPAKEVTVDDMVGVLEQFVKAGGEVVGAPTPYLVQAEKALRKGQPENLIFSEYALDKPTQSKKLKEEWTDSFKTYNDTPSNPLELAAAQKKDRRIVSRTELRQRNPDLDAKLFITGQVSSLTTEKSVASTLILIRDKKIDPATIDGIANRQKELEKAKTANVRLTPNNVDLLIRRLPSMTSTPAAGTPQTTTVPTPQTTATPDWNAVSAFGGEPALVAFEKLWYLGKPLTPADEEVLRKVYARFPLGESNYETWKKRTMRQLFDKTLK